ncbi:nucleic acid-binding, OB-fold protein [Artemisia annua]|uniref:Nucleic acid-binding, OB-fold protein n=1 Tax=Artemisia annua TaxID=35608 RepID=A0A2U1LXI3_ARTAN|nr:nucleic acid-binding, OB-fold protein [Artemisia annua]
MAQFVNGYINDLSAVKDNVKLRVRVLRSWMQPVFGKPITNMELINTRIQATIRQKQVDKYKHQLEEGNAVTLQCYALGEIQPKYRIVKNGIRLSFLAYTIVEKYVIGQVIACDDLDCFDKNGKAGKKKPITLLDAEDNEMRCKLWGAFAQQFSDFLQTCDDHSKIIVVLHLGKMGVQNGYNATRLFLFNGKESITTSEFKDVDDFRQRLLAKKADETSEHTTARISTASRYSTKEDFTTSAEMRHIVELLDIPKIVQLTEEARLRKPMLQRWLDQFGESYKYGSDHWAHLQRVLGLMVKASLCALVVAPLGYATTISASAKKGPLR